jgi:hypothetical protein
LFLLALCPLNPEIPRRSPQKSFRIVNADQVDGPAPAQVTAWIPRGHAVEVAQPALETAVVSVDVVDVNLAAGADCLAVFKAPRP